jgi:hypothetical protein
VDDDIEELFDLSLEFEFLRRDGRHRTIRLTEEKRKGALSLAGFRKNQDWEAVIGLRE